MTTPRVQAPVLSTTGERTHGCDTRTRFSLSSWGAPAALPDRRRDGSSGKLVAGRYRLRSLLGTGGMGAVWLAVDEVLGRPVALKELTLPEAVINRVDASKRVLNEARAASQVDHPGVVRIHDVAMEDGRGWIVMEALIGQTLEQAIRERGRLPVGQVVDIAVQLLEALRAVHSRGIVHRDVKPSNVQLSGGRRGVVLTDFGLATRSGISPSAEPGQLLGSPPYMAPETLQDGRCAPASDLFSLGATLYSAVEGCPPFGDDTPYSTLHAVRNEAPPPARHAGSLRPVIDGLLTKDPDRRLGSWEAHRFLTAVPSGRLAPRARHMQPGPAVT